MFRLGFTIEPLEVNGVVYRDSKQSKGRSDAKDLEIARKYTFEYNRRFDFMKSLTGLEPGCSTLRDDTAWKEFELSKTTRDYAKWRRERESLRSDLDRQTNNFILMHAIKDKIPQGGILIYNMQLVGINKRVVRYIASCGPFISSFSDGIDFMLYALDNPMPAFNKQGKAIMLQLEEWKFPVEEVRNRWDTSRPLAATWVPEFQEKHELVLNTRGDQEFAVSLTKRASLTRLEV